MDDQRCFLTRAEIAGDGDVEGFGAVDAESLCVRSFFELQREDAHADQVRAMDALEALSDDGAYAEEFGAFRGPVAGGTGAVLLAGDDHERRSFLLILH